MKQSAGDLAEIAAGLLLAAIVLVVLASFVARYILQLAIGWPEELARYIAVWLTFVGAAAAGARGEQISVDLLARLVPANLQRLFGIVIAMLSIVAMAILVWAMAPLFLGPAAQATSPGTGIARFWIYLALPIGAAGLFVQLFADLRDLLLGRPVKTAETGEAPHG